MGRKRKTIVEHAILTPRTIVCVIVLASMAATPRRIAQAVAMERRQKTNRDSAVSLTVRANAMDQRKWSMENVLCPLRCAQVHQSRSAVSSALELCLCVELESVLSESTPAAHFAAWTLVQISTATVRKTGQLRSIALVDAGGELSKIALAVAAAGLQLIAWASAEGLRSETGVGSACLCNSSER